LEFDEARLVIETFLNSESYKLCEISNKETSEVLLNLMEMVKKKEKERLYTPMVLYLKVNSLIIYLMEKVK
jgi:hypothetical protein